MTLQVITKSALTDKIKEAWRMTKTKEFPIPGDYYYHSIDTGILFNKQIEIKSEHLPRELYNYIKTLDIKTIKYVLQRSILEIFAEKYGASLASTALKEH